jgi:hypothetical protein
MIPENQIPEMCLTEAGRMSTIIMAHAKMISVAEEAYVVYLEVLL